MSQLQLKISNVKQLAELLGLDDEPVKTIFTQSLMESMGKAYIKTYLENEGWGTTRESILRDLKAEVGQAHLDAKHDAKQTVLEALAASSDNLEWVPPTDDRVGRLAVGRGLIQHIKDKFDGDLDRIVYDRLNAMIDDGRTERWGKELIRHHLTRYLKDRSASIQTSFDAVADAIGAGGTGTTWHESSKWRPSDDGLYNVMRNVDGSETAGTCVFENKEWTTLSPVTRWSVIQRVVAVLEEEPIGRTEEGDADRKAQ